MKHIFFNQDNANAQNLVINGNWLVGNNINFANNAAVIFGIGAPGAINIGGGKILNGHIHVDPIVDAIVTISTPETTNLAL